MTLRRTTTFASHGRRTGRAARAAAGAALLAAVCAAAGCGPRVQPDELGQIVYDAGQLPGAGEAYPLPQLDEAAEGDPQDRESEDGARTTPAGPDVPRADGPGRDEPD